MKKNITLTVLLVILCIGVNAQTEFRPGVILTGVLLCLSPFIGIDLSAEGDFFPIFSWDKDRPRNLVSYSMNAGFRIRL